MIRVFIVIPLLLAVVTLRAQHQEIGEDPLIWKTREKNEVDSNAILHAFRNGRASGHLRYFFMDTQNEGDLTNYFAHAAGGGLKFETARYKGFQMGISGFFIFNIGSSDFLKTDQRTGQYNRYEIGLFDIGDPTNKRDIDRLEELYLKYNWKNSSITFGKQLINTPFINLQDGRMRPTEVNGLWSNLKFNTALQAEGGLIYQISPRGTVDWYRIGESIGIYNSGVDITGRPSNYSGHTETKGILMAGITYRPRSSLTIHLWEMLTENVFNAAMVQVDAERKLPNDQQLIAGVQLIRIDRVGDGGNEDPLKQYMQQKGATTIGARVGWENKKWKTSLNYNRITREGRYLMPREWGRDPFFTFMPRERNEGLADVHAWVAKAQRSFPEINGSVGIAVGRYRLPNVLDASRNKYGLPSYDQLNVDIRYYFKKLLKGMDMQVLYVYKKNGQEANLDKRFIINRVNMSQWNIVLNYNF